MSSSGAAAGFGLLSASSWGGSDFAGGLGARRGPALLIVLSGHAFTLAILLAVCLFLRLPVPGFSALMYAAVGGLEGAFALALFYRALAMGTMGLTAALCGLLTALVPVFYSVVRDGLPAPLASLGLALGLCAIWLIARSPDAEGRPPGSGSVIGSNRLSAARTPLLMGALAGIGFGTQLVLLKMTGAANILWVMVDLRAAGVAGLIAVTLVAFSKGLPNGVQGRVLRFGVLAGGLDTAGNMFYMLASRVGRLDAAALISSLYPGGTILLAMLVLGEKPSRRQLAGIALALAAVALLGA